MTKEIDLILNEWKFSRKNTIEFIRTLGDEGLKKKLSRPALDTFCKHFQEMISVQKVYADAIKTGVMSFDEMSEDYDGLVSADELITQMNNLDNEMIESIRQSAFSSEIKWEDGERKNISSHLCALSTHEIFHVGQLVAFCYVEGMELPKYVVDNWALPVQD